MYCHCQLESIQTQELCRIRVYLKQFQVSVPSTPSTWSMPRAAVLVSVEPPDNLSWGGTKLVSHLLLWSSINFRSRAFVSVDPPDDLP